MPKRFQVDDATPQEQGSSGLPQQFRILNDPDSFRLIIRGFALIDEELDVAIDEAFVNGTPDQLDRLRLPAKLALLEALDVLPSDTKEVVARLGKVRHQLAHGTERELTDAESQELFDLARPLIPDQAIEAMENQPPIGKTRIAIVAAWSAVRDAAERARNQRLVTAEALALWQDRHRLSLENVLRILESDDED